MGATDQPPTLQPHKIATDAGCRRPGNGQQFFDGGGSGAEKKLDDLFGTAID